MKKRPAPALLYAASLLITAPGDAAVQLASPFTDHMVLQREMPVPVWGTAEAGEEVTVEFAGQKRATRAGFDGRWRVELTAMPVSAESRTFLVTGSATAQPVLLSDVLVGEVWLASGQSNMAFTMSKSVSSWAGVFNEEQEIAAANYPLMRMFTGEGIRAYEPQGRVPGDWKVCSPETAPAFSAIGYYFARELQKELNVPFGIVTLAYGASCAEAWISRESIASEAALLPMLERFDRLVGNYEPPTVGELQQWEKAAAAARPAGQRPPRRPRPDPVQDQHNSTVLYNGMVHPFVPFALRGVLWYQGESIVGGDAGRALYPTVQATLVRDWRRRWQRALPFYIVQLAGQEANSNSPVVREAQATLLDLLPNTGMAVTTDIGEARDVHPHNKAPVGDRLARIALANVYGRAIEYSGPRFQSATPEGGAIRVRFTHTTGGLTTKNGEALKWFEVAGADGTYAAAHATIDGDTVVVRSPAVATPVHVRYAWVNFPDGGHLYNGAGLPAAQFRSDRR